MKSTHARAGSPDPRSDKAVDNGGLRYGAMECALCRPLPSATRASLKIQIHARLTNPAKPNMIIPIRAKLTPVGRHQIGTPADFKSESVAGFLLECVAGFVGIRGMKGLPLRSLHFRSGK